jgi:hypothetical protein
VKYTNIKEEELKNKVAHEYFWIYDCTKIIGNVDFCVRMFQKKELFEEESLLWAEAKTGSADIYRSIVQLILTIGKARTFDKHLPPPMLGALDGEKIAFVPYGEIQDYFYQNDFNWNVTPSDHKTKEFQLLYEKTKNIINQKALLFNYENDHKELQKFIKNNFKIVKFGLYKTKIDKTNFMIIYNKWIHAVKPTVDVKWDIAKKSGVIDGDFYLADLLSYENNTLKEKLDVLLKYDHYELHKQIDDAGLFVTRRAEFMDQQKAHTQFWNRYDRPPREEYWDYLVKRRDLLVPPDIREIKGSFFTPQIWVELSQKYLTDVLGEDWQEEYYVWDCAAGTGNLLNGLTNKYNIWASTLDRQDVEVMKDRIKNGTNLLEDHVFQFDFLNDEFSKLPQPLQDIINDPEKRKKLVIYVNPPYAEGDARIGKGRKGVQLSRIHDKYQNDLKKASGELFAQFFARIYREIPGAILAEFSTLKILQAPNFINFRTFFQAKLEKLFVVPADTFDNVKGQFPIGFFIWDTDKQEKIKECLADVYDRNSNYLGNKKIYLYDGLKFISDWLEENSKNISKNYIGHLASVGNDFQNQNAVFIDDVNKIRKKGGRHTMITLENLVVVAVYFAVRHCIKAVWLNDRDQFLYPKDEWIEDTEFQADCLAYTLFSNNIQSGYGINYWIPFTEQEINAREKFACNFMTQFIQGKLKEEVKSDLFGSQKVQKRALAFSPEATHVFNKGRELWKYYHKQKNCNVNASLYDIREYFQGRNAAGKMNTKSNDKMYTELISDLRESLKKLEIKIEQDVYKYQFLRK